MPLRRAMPAVTLILGLGACGTPPLPPEPVQIGKSPADFPEAHYGQARSRGQPVLQIDPERSLVAIEVRRAGALGRLGHDHVVASHDLKGFVAPEDGRADLFFPVEQLVVDEPDLRTAAGFDTQPSKEAIEGTRRNMLDKVLEAERFPFVSIRAVRKDADTLRVAITLHGTTREMDVPARIDSGPGGMAVSGRLSVNQSDFGIVPFSVLGGALQVANRLEIRFQIQARSF